jgi:hypothetical protein
VRAGEIIHAEASAFDGVYITKDVDEAYAPMSRARTAARSSANEPPRALRCSVRRSLGSFAGWWERGGRTGAT